MTNAYILTASGFILGDNKHYEVLTSDQVFDTSLFTRTAFTHTNSNLLEEVKSNRLYHSVVANTAYAKYAATGSFDDYMTLVDIAADILSACDYSAFFAIQAGNRNMSPISFKFCVDVYSRKFFSTYHTYATVPGNIRLTSDNGLTNSQVSENISTLRHIKTENTSNWASNWAMMISALANDKSAFSVFFKYLFVDAY